MRDDKKKVYTLDGDSLEITFRYDELSKKHLGEYPDFIECPRITPGGRKWVDVITEDCPYADGDDKTCGTCSFMLKQDEKDIIGICMNEKFKKNK